MKPFNCPSAMHTLFRHHHDALLLVDANYAVLCANPACDRIFIGTLMDPLLACFPKRSRQELRQAIQDACANRTNTNPMLSVPLDTDLHHPDDSTTPIQLTFLSAPPNCWLILHDRSTHQRLEQAQQHALDKAEQASRAKSSFLAMMSHEIRTPLNAIIGSLQLCQDEPLSRNQRRFIATASNAGESLLSIINDILDFSKIEAGKMTLESASFCPVTLIEDAVEIMADRAHHKGLPLLCSLAPDLPDQVIGDPGRIRQVVLNLISNAIKFTHDGHIKVHARMDAQQPSQLIVTVSDTGIGISERVQERLFADFMQADNSYDRQFGGTGLGLAICQRFSQMMGGEISCNSTLGEGSRFRVQVPLHLPESTMAPAAWLQHAHQMQNLRVFIADQNPISAQIMQQQLQDWGMQVSTSQCEDTQMLDRWLDQQQPFDLILLHENLSHASCQQLVSHLETSPHAEAPCLLLHSAGQQHTDRFALPGAIHLALPVRRHALYRSLCEALHLSWLPDADPTADTADQPNEEPHRILLAEDSQSNQLVAVTMLRKMGHTIDVASNGQEAVDAMQARPYDLVLMDLSMPEMNGFDATRIIRRLPGERGNVPIIAMTANIMPMDLAQCEVVGMQGYLGKPFKRDALMHAIRQHARCPQQAADGQCPLVHSAVLQTLKENIDEMQFPELIQLFCEEVAERLHTLKSLQPGKDNAAIQQHAHALISSAATFGLLPLSQSARAIEQSCREQDTAALLAAHTPLLELGEASLDALNQWKRSRP